MRDLLTSRRFALATAVVGLGAATAAIGLPWDVDMADSQGHKAYEAPMKGIAEGAVAQANVLTPVGFVPNFDRTTPEGQALASPFEVTDATLASGKRMFGIYCTPCHGDGQTLGPIGGPGRFPGVATLSGPAGILKNRTDGWVYLTIRNGGAVMPYYGWAMTDAEMWSIVHYVRTLPDSAYIPPAPAEETPK